MSAVAKKDDPAVLNRPVAPRPLAPVANTASTKQLSLSEVKGIWQHVIDNIGKTRISVATYLSEGALLEVQANCLIVAFPKNSSLHKDVLEKKENKMLLETPFRNGSCRDAD